MQHRQYGSRTGDFAHSGVPLQRSDPNGAYLPGDQTTSPSNILPRIFPISYDDDDEGDDYVILGVVTIILFPVTITSNSAIAVPSSRAV